MEICIFQTGEPLHIDEGNYRPMRCMLLADKLIEKGHKVTIISSAFFHQRKIHRSKHFKLFTINTKLRIYLIPSTGYKKHISVSRIFDHIILSFNLYLFLKKYKFFKPDRVFMGYPPIITSFVITRWSIIKRIPVMIDIKDKWPETFIEPFPKFFKPLAKLLFKPYFILARYAFKKANKISTISDGFSSWTKDFIQDKKSDKYYVYPLTRKPFSLSEDDIFKSIKYWENKNINILNDQYFCFIGSYSRSFNFEFIYDLSRELFLKFPYLKIILCGSGDKYKTLIKKFSSNKNVFVFGEIDKYNAKVLIKNALATLAPYNRNINFNDHIPNKIIESLENGTPFVTTLEGTLKNIIKEYNNGIFLSEDKKSDIKFLEKLIKEKEYQINLSNNATKSYKKLFDFNSVYNSLIDNLISI